MKVSFPDLLERMVGGETLTRAETRDAMNAIMAGEATPAQIGAFLLAHRMRGNPTVDEIAGAAEAMRSHAAEVTVSRRPLLDTCGTGGDGTGTFNISTAAAFVAAGGGIAVAKHGNRSISSRCGSADVLEALGARIDLAPAQVEACLNATGFGFLFAPKHHGAMKHAAGPRRELGVRTLFNLLGPLCNPASATHQVMGVYDRELTAVIAGVLGLLGSEGALVVHGAGGLDELSLQGVNQVSRWQDGQVTTELMDPATLGLGHHANTALAGGNASTNADIVRRVLDGEAGAARNVVVLNAGAAFWITGEAESLESGVRLAEAVIDRGAAAEALDAYLQFTREAS